MNNNYYYYPSYEIGTQTMWLVQITTLPFSQTLSQTKIITSGSQSSTRGSQAEIPSSPDICQMTQGLLASLLSFLNNTNTREIKQCNSRAESKRNNQNLGKRKDCDCLSNPGWVQGQGVGVSDQVPMGYTITSRDQEKCTQNEDNRNWARGPRIRDLN